ncbi:MAG: D-galactonate dehydratase family protein [Flammeovirgaceae bacterium]|nr:D-galactonate dehydratase family protein [Flammeovirgaceae bacterium]
MKITKVQVIVHCPARNFVTVKVHSDQGVYGLGDATLNGRELAVSKYIEEYLTPSLIGKSPFDTEDIWQFFYKGVYWRRGAVNMTAIGAIDIALWDLKAKLLNVPLYQLLGGKSRNKILTYCHGHGTSFEDTIEKVLEKKEAGYEAIRVQSGIPGLDKIYGMNTKKGAKYEPAIAAETPFEEEWDTSKYLNHVPRLFEKVREAVGDEVHLLHDGHHRLTPIEAARLGKELEPFHLFWLEDLVAGEMQESFRLIRNHTTTPLALGEVFNTMFDCKTLLEEELIDHLRMAVSHGGGITPMKKIAALAELHHVKISPHGPSDISPIGIAAALHLVTAINNFGVHEYMGYEEQTLEAFPHAFKWEKGYLHLDETPGLGVDINMDLVDKYPYKKAFLPVNRLTDGTMFHW